MANLILTWSEQNQCWVKILGAWIAEDSKERTPRFFRFRHPHTPEGMRAAQAELVPLVAQWQTIKAEAKKRGEKKPVWYREKFAIVKSPNTFDLATVKTPTEDDDASQLSNLEKAENERREKLRLATALALNAEANPVKPLVKASIQEAKERYCRWYGESGVKGGTAKGVCDQLKAVCNCLAPCPCI